MSDTGSSTQGVNPPYVIMIGICFVVLFFTLFMICARQWDKWITKKFFSTQIFLPQHINSFGSSHMSAIVDDSRWNMSEGSESVRDDIDLNSDNSGNNAWVDEMMQELSNFHSIIERGVGRAPVLEQSSPAYCLGGSTEYEHNHVRTSGESTSSSDIVSHQPVRVNTNSQDSDWSSITGSSSGGVISSEDYDSYLTSYESYTCSSDSDTVKIKNSNSDPPDGEKVEESVQNPDPKQNFGYHLGSEREV